MFAASMNKSERYRETIGAVIVFVWAGSYIDALINPEAITVAASITPVMLAFVGWLFWKRVNGDSDKDSDKDKDGDE